MRFALAMAACCVPLISAAQPAADAGRRTYVFAKIGAVIPQGDDMDPSADGVAFEVGGGFEITPHVAIEAGVGHFGLKYRTSGTDPYTVVSSGGPWEYSEDVSVTPVFANLRLFARTTNVQGVINAAGVYALLGVGGYFMSADGTRTGSGAFTRSGSDTSVSFQVGGGVVLHLPRGATLGFEAKYGMADATLFTLTRRVDTVFVAGTLGFSF